MKDLKQNIQENLKEDTNPYPRYYTKYKCVLKCISYDEIICVDVQEDTVDVNITNLSEGYFIKEGYARTNEAVFMAELKKSFIRFDKLINL